MPEAILNGYKHYWEEGGNGDPLVMVHGAAGSSRMLIDHLEPLSHHFRVIIPDLRAMGRSEHLAGIPGSAWIDDLKALLDHLGIASAHLYGVSLGARVVLRAAIDHPSIARSLILDAPIVANDPEGNAALNSNLGSLDNMPPEQQEARRQTHGEDWRAVMQNYMNIRNDPGVQEYLNLRESSKGVTCPTLIMRGDVWEPVHPLPHAVELHQSIRGSWLWIRPNTGSAVLMTAAEEAYWQIGNFVQHANRQAVGSS
jgi:pimeloyl-ACP methyl ester carboxylesterase